MALYISAGRRRRRLLVAAAAALVLGLVIGLIIGRATTPSIGDRTAQIKTEVRDTSAALRVLTLHEQAGVSGSANEIDLVISRTRDKLKTEFGRAPWIGQHTKQQLLAALDRLAAMPNRGSTFGAAAERTAALIDSAFGIT